MRFSTRSVALGLALTTGLLLAVYLSFRTPTPEPDPEAFGLYEQGVALLARDAPDSAAAVLREAVRRDSTFADAWVLLAAVEQGRWAWDAAGRAYQRALSAESNNPILLHNHAAYLVMIGQFGPAIDQLGRALELAPDDPDLHALLGWAHFVARRYDDAEAPFREALRLDPDHTVALRGLLQLYDALERPDAIRAEADRLDSLPQYRAWQVRADSAAAAALVADLIQDRDGVPTTYALEAAVLTRQWALFFDELDRWSRTGSGSVLPVWLPRVDLQRFDPRFEAAIERMGLGD